MPRHARTSVAQSGGFECSDPLLNRIHSNVTWTFACSLQGYPQDAADRSERVGWLGDPVVDDFAFTFDTVLFWSKWLDDLADSQLPSGDLPVISPLHWRRTYDCYLWYPVWKSSYPIVAWDVYLESGDPRVLERHYDRIENLVRFLQSHADGHLLAGGLGDHMEPQPDGTSAFAPVHTPAGLTSSAIYCRDVQILAWAAAVLGDERRAEEYSRLAADIRDAFNERYLDRETADYATGSQGSNAIPLALGLVPAGYEDGVLDNIVADIEGPRDGHLSTGMLGTDALARGAARRRSGRCVLHRRDPDDVPELGRADRQGRDHAVGGMGGRDRPPAQLQHEAVRQRPEVLLPGPGRNPPGLSGLRHVRGRAPGRGRADPRPGRAEHGAGAPSRPAGGAATAPSSSMWPSRPTPVPPSASPSSERLIR